MTPHPPTEFVHVPRVWPALVVSSGIALVLWPLAARVGHPKGFVGFAAVAFCAGIVAVALAFRRRVGFVPLALPAPGSRVWLLRFRAWAVLGSGSVRLALTTMKANPASSVDAPIASLFATVRQGRRATDQPR